MPFFCRSVQLQLGLISSVPTRPAHVSALLSDIKPPIVHLQSRPADRHKLQRIVSISPAAAISSAIRSQLAPNDAPSQTPCDAARRRGRHYYRAIIYVRQSSRRRVGRRRSHTRRRSLTTQSVRRHIVTVIHTDETSGEVRCRGVRPAAGGTR